MSANQRGFAHLGLLAVVVVALIGGVGSMVYMRSQESQSATPASQVHAHRPGVVSAAVASKSVNSQGAPTDVSKVFKPTDDKILVTASLKNAKAGTRIAFTRYLKGKFVDNGSLSLSKAGSQYATFTFSVKQGKTHPVGKYTVKLYTNGVYERSAHYSVQQ